MTTPGRGEVWTGEQLTARLVARHGVAPDVTQHAVYRAMGGPDGYLVAGETAPMTQAAFDFWLAKRGMAGPERLAVAVLVVAGQVSPQGELQDCALEHRRGAMDGPYCGDAARITFSGAAQDVRFYQATPDGQLTEIAPAPPDGARTDPVREEAEPGGAAVSQALRLCFGASVRVVGARAPTVVEAMVGIAQVLHVAGRGGHEHGCGILWHGPIAVALPAPFPRFDVAPRLLPQQQAALDGLLAAEGLLACETRRDEHGLAVLARRRGTTDLFLVRFDRARPLLAPYLPGRPAAIAEAQGQWLHYVETYEHLRLRDAYHDGTTSGLIVMTQGPDGKAWRHSVDEDGVETWRTEDTDTLAWEVEQAAPAALEAPVPAGHAPAVAPFGALVDQRFPGAAYDIEEAARCLAAGHATAAVFHAMRIVEHALRGYAQWRGEDDPLAHDAGRRWRALSRWVGDDAGAEAVHPALTALRTAWRGGALQVAAKYTETESARIVAATGDLLRCIAGLCDEDGVPATELADDER